MDDSDQPALGSFRFRGVRAVALIRLGQVEAGADLLRNPLQQPVGEPLLYYEMARLSERSDEPDEARRYYRKGFELMLADRAARRRGWFKGRPSLGRRISARPLPIDAMTSKGQNPPMKAESAFSLVQFVQNRTILAWKRLKAMNVNHGTCKLTTGSGRKPQSWLSADDLRGFISARFQLRRGIR